MPSPVPGHSKKPLKMRSSKRKESRTKAQKRERNKEDSKKDSDRSKEDSRDIAGERIPVLDSSAVKDCVESDIVGVGSNLARMEARRRKFESLGPVKPDGKKICLKATQQPCEQQERDITDQGVQKRTVEGKDGEMVGAVAASDDSTVLEAVEDFDEPYLELQSGDLWSSEEGDSDNEARFKSSARIQVSGSEKVTLIVLVVMQ